MPIQKIKSGRVITVDAVSFVGDKGTIFYDEDVAQLRLSDGITPGGILFSTGTGGSYVLTPATTSTLGGIKVGANLTISPDGTLSANTATSGVSNSFKTIKVSGQQDVVASGEDTLQIVSGNGIIVTTNPTTATYKTLTISSIGVPNIDGGFPDDVYDIELYADGGSP